ncbi:MAG TPA: isochorismate synthase [Acidimicrobiia bacterium]|nr:isochorismate synthase [Acidimicrobiia bacterium]
MLISRPILADLAVRLHALPSGLRAATVDVGDLDPLDVVRAGAAAFGFAAFFSSVDGRSVGALGVSGRVAASGPDRFARLDDGLRRMSPPDAIAPIGFSFADDGPSSAEWEGFPAAVAVVPQITVTRSAGRSQLSVSLPSGSDGQMLLALVSTLRPPAAPGTGREVDHAVESRPSPHDWLGLVAEAVAGIRGAAMQKVVLARSVAIRSSTAFEPFDLVATLRDRYPECRVFGWQEGESTFIGASPELLIAREGRHFELAPLAGSAPRGTDPEHDRRLGDALLASPKDRMEHEIVVDDAVRRLTGLVTTIERSATPQLQRFATVQHLATPIGGTTDARILELAGALHPTPAVGGAPRAEALAFIDKMEGIDRGWYAGGIGWADGAGNGEIALGLRSALVRGDQAIVYAGNGIVRDSEPEAELEETRLKLRPMLDLLT